MGAGRAGRAAEGAGPCDHVGGTGDLDLDLVRPVPGTEAAPGVVRREGEVVVGDGELGEVGPRREAQFRPLVRSFSGADMKLVEPNRLLFSLQKMRSAVNWMSPMELKMKPPIRLLWVVPVAMS